MQKLMEYFYDFVIPGEYLVLMFNNLLKYHMQQNKDDD